MSKIKSVFSAFRISSNKHANIQCIRQYKKVSLEKIGESVDKREPSKLYESGQTFIHKAFPYRGIVVYSWPVKVHDYALDNLKKSNNGKIEDGGVNVKSQNNVQTYYQVLVDSRDSHRKHFNNKNLVVKYFPDHTQKVIEIPDIDYVAHEDIIPYQSTVPVEPIFHPAFYTFFNVHTDVDRGHKLCKIMPFKIEAGLLVGVSEHGQRSKWQGPAIGHEFFIRDEVKQAQLTDNSWMCVSDVYKDTTDDICVTVIPFYMGSRFGSSHTWRYSVRIDYLGEEKITVLDKILHLTIDNNLITNAGIMMDCTLTKKVPSYQFYDNILLETASAQMWGEFSLERADESRTRCTIPVIKLSVFDNQNLRLSITDLKNLGS